jgi:FkbM family methyltransferase
LRPASGTDRRAVSVVGRLVVNVMNGVPAPVARRLSTRSFASRILRPIVNRAVPCGPVPVTVRSGAAKGLTLLVDLSEEKYYLTGTYERLVQDALAIILRRGMSFWDVGAHVGFFTILGRQLVGSEGHVHAFEPIPENRERLLTATELNGFADVAVHADALSDRTGKSMLEERGATSTWTMVGDDRAHRCVTVRCTTIDEIGERLPAPDLIKIDVEGHEVEVIRGGLNVLRNPRVRAVVEFHSTALLVEARRLCLDHVFNQIDHGHWLMMHRSHANDA